MPVEILEVSTIHESVIIGFYGLFSSCSKSSIDEIINCLT